MSIKWNHQGFEQILCSDGAMQLCRNEAERICASATSMAGGGEFEVHTETVHRFGSNRAEAFVKAVDHRAIKACSEDKVLERSI